MTYDDYVAEYKRLAQQALDESDSKRALELCRQAIEMGLWLGYGDGKKRSVEEGG